MAGVFPFAWSTTIRRMEEVLPFCQKAAEFLREVSKSPLLAGQFVQVTFNAATSATARHSLGRPYVGAFVIASSAPSTSPAISALLPQLASDPAHFITLESPGAVTGTITLWVF